MKSFLVLLTKNSPRPFGSVVVMAIVLFPHIRLVRDRLLAARFCPDELGVYLAAFRMRFFV
jgi:hypothetical protein